MHFPLMILIFLSTLGVDRFMLGQAGAGIGKLLTGGGCGIWWLIDLFNIGKATKNIIGRNYQCGYNNR